MYKLINKRLSRHCRCMCLYSQANTVYSITCHERSPPVRSETGPSWQAAVGYRDGQDSSWNIAKVAGQSRWPFTQGSSSDRYYCNMYFFAWMKFLFCAKSSSREINFHHEWNFATFSSREIFIPAKFFSSRKLNTNSGLSQ